MPAKKNYYAVKSGHKPGIYRTWAECERQVKGFSGATYKGFVNLHEAQEFMGTSTQVAAPPTAPTPATTTADIIAYVDGSFDPDQWAFSYGLVIFHNGQELHFAERSNAPDLLEMRNVAGEIMGASKAMEYALAHNLTSLDLYYDYEGISKWPLKIWKANKPGTQAYRDYYDKISPHLKVNFIKVAAHTGDKYNELADQLAKSALGLI